MGRGRVSAVYETLRRRLRALRWLLRHRCRSGFVVLWHPFAFACRFWTASALVFLGHFCLQHCYSSCTAVLRTFDGSRVDAQTELPSDCHQARYPHVGAIQNFFLAESGSPRGPRRAGLVNSHDWKLIFSFVSNSAQRLGGREARRKAQPSKHRFANTPALLPCSSTAARHRRLRWAQSVGSAKEQNQ